MSTAALERAVGSALDVQVAAAITADMVNVARTLFALPQPRELSSPGPEMVRDFPVAEAPPEAVPAPEAVPVAIPAPPVVSPLPALPAPPGLTSLSRPSALHLPPPEVPASVPAGPAEDVVAIPASTVASLSMAMLNEIGFLDD